MSERKKLMDVTNNSTVYNRYRKDYLEKTGQIRCSYCMYHRGENRVNWYGGFIEENVLLKDSKITYPSWKLASKNRKQWMPKNNVRMTIEPPRYRGYRRQNWLYVSFEIGPKKHQGIKYSKQ